MHHHKEIYIKSNEDQNTFLRQKTKPFKFSDWEKKDIASLLRRMKRIMREANGIGLSSNQIGLPWRLFVAEVPSDTGSKFYAVFNPTLQKKSREKQFMEEGCLSIPGVYGEVERHVEVTLKGQDRNGKALKIKAWGVLAHVFQHEVDHLDGKLFIDKARSVETKEARKTYDEKIYDK